MAEPFAELMRHAGLTSLARVMGDARGTRLRQIADRENWHLRLPTVGGEQGPDATVGAYLKKHRTRTWFTWLRAKLWAMLGFSSALGSWLGVRCSPGRDEAERIAQLAAAGIPTMNLMAWGAALRSTGTLESFVLTEELAGYVQLDHYLRRRFVPTGDRQRFDPQLASLLASVAQVAGRFHAAGFNHRDLYCCHFFVRETSPGRFDVRLIDLQRVQHRRRWRHRWLVKDLAQFVYSAPKERISSTDLMRLVHGYLGVRRLSLADKRLVRQVWHRYLAMQLRLGAHP